MLFVMAFQVSLRGYLKKCLIIHSLNPLQLCPNHELGRFFKSFQTELLKKVFPETSLTFKALHRLCLGLFSAFKKHTWQTAF